MIRAILFDMDGVLIDSEPFYQQRRIAFLQSKGVPTHPDWDFTGSNERAIWETFVPDDPQRREQLKLEYRTYRKEHPADFRKLADPEVLPLFTALKEQGILIAIASSSDQQCIKAMSDACGLSNLVDFSISGEDCSKHKPDPEIYLRTLDALKLTPEEAVVIEDSPLGIRAGKQAGLMVYALKPRHGEALDQSEADQVIDSLSDILKRLPETAASKHIR